MEEKLFTIIGVILALCSSAFSFSPRMSITRSTRRWIGVDDRSWGNELGDNGVGSWGGHSSINEYLSDGPRNAPSTRSRSSSSNNEAYLSPNVRAALERTVLRTVVKVLEGRVTGSEEYHALFEASGAGKVQEDGANEDYTREDSTGPMSARMLGTMLKKVPLREYECSTLVGLKRLYNYVGGVGRFCRDHSDVITIDELNGSTDFLVSLTPDYSSALEQLADDDDSAYNNDGNFEADERDDVATSSRQGQQQQRSTIQARSSRGVPRAPTSGRTPTRQSSSPPPTFSGAASFTNDNEDYYVDHVVAPLKTMVFVDGTWLYYAIHERPTERCAIKQALGANWRSTHGVQWAMLPRLLAKAIEAELRATQRVERHVEVTRTVVFTSARATTPPSSPRITMFRDMQAANMEVHMSQTEGEREKCVDIALAVEMLHYATVPGAYDLAVLLTGDKDFMPVMTRTRQKGKRVALATMRANCNRDLLQPQSHIRDFSPIFLEHHLKELIVPLKPGMRRSVSTGGMALPKDVPVLSQEKRAALELKVLSTVVALLDAHENGPPSEGPFAELYESLSGSPSSSSNSPSDGSSNSSSSTKDEASPFDEGPMTARVLGALLRGVRLHDFKCDALTGMKWLYDNAGGIAKFCKDHPDAFTTSPVTGTTDFFVRLKPGFAERLSLQQASLLAARMPDDDDEDSENDDGDGDDRSSGTTGSSSSSSSSRLKSASSGSKTVSRQSTSMGNQDALTSAFAAANRRSSNNEDEEEEEDEEIEEDYGALTDEEDSDDAYDFADNNGEDDALLPLEDVAILDDAIIERMVVPELKEWLRALKLPVSGRKQELIDRLSEAVADAQAQALLDPKPTYSSSTSSFSPSSSSKSTASAATTAYYHEKSYNEEVDEEMDELDYEDERGEEGDEVDDDIEDEDDIAEYAAAAALMRDYEASGSSSSIQSSSTTESSDTSSSSSSVISEVVEAELITIVQNAVLEFTSNKDSLEPRRSSRQVGFTLTAQRVDSLGGRDASSSIKLVYGSLKAFLRLFPNKFDLEDHPQGYDGQSTHSFDIILKK